MSLTLNLPNSSDMTSFPDNLHSVLQLALSDRARQEILDLFTGNTVAGVANADALVNPRTIFPIIRPEGYGSDLVVFADGARAASRGQLARILSCARSEVAHPLGGGIMVWSSDHREVDHRP